MFGPGSTIGQCRFGYRGPMRPILTDTSPEGLRAAIVADIIASRIGNMDVPIEGRREPDVAWALPGAPSEARAVVAWAAFEPATVERRLDEILAAVDARGATVLWWFAPDPRPADLRERVLRRGFDRVEDTAAMAMDLARLPDSVPPPDAVRIERGRRSRGDRRLRPRGDPVDGDRPLAAAARRGPHPHRLHPFPAG